LATPDQSPATRSNSPADSSPSPYATSEQTTGGDGRKAYNVVTDTVTGVNVRWSDNRFQAVFVGISVLVLTPVGAALAALNPSWNLPWFGGGAVGAFAGLVFGIFTSGIWLGIYRFIQHMRGQHD